MRTQPRFREFLEVGLTSCLAFRPFSELEVVPAAFNFPAVKTQSTLLVQTVTAMVADSWLG